MSNISSPKSTSSTKILPSSEHGRRITWWDRYIKASFYAKIFLFISTIHAISLMVVGSISIGWEDVSNIYGSLSIYVALCFLWFMLQGALKENTIQLICSILSAVLVTMYLVWFYLIDNSHPIVASLAFGSACFCVLYLIIAPCVVKKFGWYRYNKSQTTNKHIMKIYLTYQKWISMLLMDAEVCIMLVLLVTFELKHKNQLGYIGNISCILFEVLWVTLGIRAVRAEHKLTTQGFMCCTIFLIIYICVICYWIATDQEYSQATSEPQFFVLSTLAIIVRALSMFWTYKVINNFDKGLRQYFDQGSHYIDFWKSNQQLLAPNSDYDKPIGAGQAQGQQNSKQTDGMTSKSRIHSDDFD
eukprot:428702_1